MKKFIVSLTAAVAALSLANAFAASAAPEKKEEAKVVIAPEKAGEAVVSHSEKAVVSHSHAEKVVTKEAAK